MPTLFRVDVVLSFTDPVSPEEVERVRADLDLPLPTLETGQVDPAAGDVRVDEDGRGADLVLLVEAETDVAAREAVQDAVGDALSRGRWDEGSARVDLVRSTGAYDL